jgi:hypothetical protein
MVALIVPLCHRAQRTFRQFGLQVLDLGLKFGDAIVFVVRPKMLSRFDLRREQPLGPVVPHVLGTTHCYASVTVSNSPSVTVTRNNGVTA